jgi:predicted nucleotidyltransferase
LLMELDFQTIFKELNGLGIDYLVVGGLAVNFHGVPRMTYDIDLMILLEPENVIKLVTKLTQWGYKPKIPIDPRDLADETKRTSWILEKGMKALNFYSETLPIGEIDILIDTPVPYEELKGRAIKVELQDEKIPTVSIHDLIELKLRAGRKQDLADVEHLKMVLEKG